VSRWGVSALLFGATLLNYLDRQALAVTAPLLRGEMRLDLAQLGLLLAIFYWSYAAGQVVVGLALDRLNVRVAYAVAVAAWSLAGAAAGLVTGFWSLAILRALLGLCEAANWPAALRVVAGAFVPRERALANGIFQSGSSVGALLAPPLLIWIATAHGWRVGFVVVGAAGLLWVALWLALYRPVRVPATVVSQREAHESPVALGWIVRSRGFLGLVVASAFLNPSLYFYVNWLPTYFVESGQPFGKELAAMLFVVYLALDVGYLSGGALVRALAARWEVTRARRVVSAAAVPLMVAVVLVPSLGTLVGVLATMAGAALGVGGFMVCYLASVQEVSSARVATVAGFLGAAGSVAGAVFMWLVGRLAAGGGFVRPFVVLGLMPFVALAGLWIATERERRPTQGSLLATARAEVT
jgi:ACS family hexuronate transporter-like MFS transporter